MMYLSGLKALRFFMLNEDALAELIIIAGVVHASVGFIDIVKWDNDNLLIL